MISHIKWENGGGENETISLLNAKNNMVQWCCWKNFMYTNTTTATESTKYLHMYSKQYAYNYYVYFSLLFSLGCKLDASAWDFFYTIPDCDFIVDYVVKQNDESHLSVSLSFFYFIILFWNSFHSLGAFSTWSKSPDI